MMQGDIRWRSGPNKRQGAFGADGHDFRFFVFICIFIYFLAGIFFLVTGVFAVRWEDEGEVGEEECHCRQGLEHQEFIGLNYGALSEFTTTLGKVAIWREINVLGGIAGLNKHWFQQWLKQEGQWGCIFFQHKIYKYFNWLVKLEA